MLKYILISLTLLISNTINAQVQDPVITFNDSIFYNQNWIKIEIIDSTNTGQLFYTLDGSDPSYTNGTAIGHNSHFKIKETSTFKVIAYHKDLSSTSNIISQNFYKKCITPTFFWDVKDTFPDTAWLVYEICFLESNHDTSDIMMYTTDGSDPSETNGKIWKGVIPITETCMLKMVNTAPNCLPSAIESKHITILPNTSNSNNAQSTKYINNCFTIKRGIIYGNGYANISLYNLSGQRENIFKGIIKDQIDISDIGANGAYILSIRDNNNKPILIQKINVNK